MDNVLQALRLRTKEMHMSLHEHPLLVSCQKGEMNRVEYVQLLKAFYSPWKLITPAISSFPIDSLKENLKQRSEAIRNDLLALEISVDSKDKSKNEDYTPGELLGISYVIIGSSMGASVLSENIKKSLGINIPVSYLSMSPKLAGWPTLSSALRELKHEDYPKASEAAVKIFKLIDAELTN